MSYQLDPTQTEYPGDYFVRLLLVDFLDMIESSVLEKPSCMALRITGAGELL